MILHHAMIRAMRSANAEDVELDANGVPVAFRIWKFGENVTDHGVHTFSKRSAKLLVEEQAARGNLYSIDVDHLSLNDQAPPESRKAVGWHRLEVRADGLWAVSAEWTEAVKAGLAKEPPEWRYFSPAYDVDKKTGEIVSYLNTALTNNPATWSVTALASRKENVMGYDFKAALAAMMGDDGEKKEAARAGLVKCAEGDDGDAKKAAAMLAAFGEPDGDEEPKKEPEKKEEKKAAEDPPEHKEPDGDEPKKDSIAATAAALAKVGEAERRIDRLEKIAEAEERAKILAARPDLTKGQLDVLQKEPLAALPKLLALIPAPTVDPAAADKVTATRGAGQGGGVEVGAQRAARLPPRENRELAERMGRFVDEDKGVHWDPDHPNDLVFETMTREQARARLAARAKAGIGGPPSNPADKAANGGAR